MAEATGSGTTNEDLLRDIDNAVGAARRRNRWLWGVLILWGAAIVVVSWYFAKSARRLEHVEAEANQVREQLQLAKEEVRDLRKQFDVYSTKIDRALRGMETLQSTNPDALRRLVEAFAANPKLDAVSEELGSLRSRIAALELRVAPPDQRKRDLYRETVAVTSRIANAKGLEAAQSDIKRFWELYWGDLTQVEDSEVEIAMVRFGRILKDVEENPTSFAGRQEDLQRASLAVGRATRPAFGEGRP